MRYSTQPDRFPNTKPFPFCRCDCRDAEGNILGLPVVFVDTESGVVIGLKQLYEYDENYNFVLVTSYHPAPLTIVPRRGYKGKVVTKLEDER